MGTSDRAFFRSSAVALAAASDLWVGTKATRVAVKAKLNFEFEYNNNNK
jgi:hypothetical protein